MGGPRVTAERFWEQVDRSAGPRACWPWTGARQSQGYGITGWQGGRMLAHRLALSLSGVDIPPPLEPDHTCRNKLCCNPDHLEVVTHAENMRRAAPFITRGPGWQTHKTHCPEGHPYDDVNTYVTPAGHRQCRTCNRRRDRARRLTIEST